MRILGTRQEALAGADLLVTVSPPTVEEVDQLPEGATLVSLLPPAWNVDVIARLRDRGVSAFSFDLVPRTSRAQAMDALSSQASLAGYQAALVAADRLGRAFPMMMTAAGTVPPARVLVMGAGRGRAAGHRHRPAAGRGGQRLRRPPGGGRRGAQPGRHLPGAAH